MDLERLSSSFSLQFFHATERPTHGPPWPAGTRKGERYLLALPAASPHRLLVRFTELAKMGKEAKGDSGTPGPSTRISLSNSSQTKISGGPAGSRTTFPCKSQ